jgi:hypothetical protein
VLNDWGQLMSTTSTPTLGIIFAVVVMVAPGAIAQDQHKCAPLQPVAGASGYKLRPGDVRCEGFYQSPVSGARVELFSLTSGGLNYDLQSDQVLYVTSPDVGALDVGKTRIVAVQAKALPLEKYYRMDATMPPGGTLAWPMSEVLTPERLTPGVIGVVAWLEREGKPIFVPVAVSPAKPRSITASVTAVFRSSVDLNQFQWRTRPEGSTAQAPEWTSLGAGSSSLRAGRPLRFSFELPGGLTLLEIAARAINSDNWQTPRFIIFRP